jgi:Protein of unknown function (DUF3592)
VRRKVQGSFLIAAAVMALMALISAGMWYAVAAKSRLIAAEGVAVVAEVTGLEVEVSHGKNGPTRKYMVDLVFPGPEGQQVSARRSVSRSLYNRLAPGSDLRLRYAASDPTVIEIEPGAMAEGAGLAGWSALLFLALTAVFAGAEGLRRRRTGR